MFHWMIWLIDSYLLEKVNIGLEQSEKGMVSTEEEVHKKLSNYKTYVAVIYFQPKRWREIS